ncbi:ABC transporter substrate-binding protein [Tabrizicola sp.]|uniref:ABC transporter substrate-binding protein n=1 Tax=Tabrizicola sp. TaxID=2005166 RepID=UPI0026043368|nr:ABC transporter substrate-binding protein [Tabrizicola sp.]MDM7930983.1 ABC transporter substrate-binding protein [Tabrizicola sp.]
MKCKLYASAAALALMASGAVAQDLSFPVGEGAFNWASFEEFKAANTGVAGEVLTIAGPWLGPDQELVESMLAYFEAATGVDVKYVGSDSFEQQVRIDAEAGSSANISVFPQPGLTADLAKLGFVAPLTDADADWLRNNYAAGQSWVDLASFAGPDGNPGLFGFFYKVDVKSLVWYNPENFEDAGYAVPQTMEELKTLTDQMVADGVTPWCIGLGSGGATGWPATDWVEDLMLRTQTPADYDAWVRNDLPFNDAKVVAAIDEFGWFIDGDRVSGGKGAVATTDFRDSPKGLFASPPQCMMHRQASFIPSFFPEGTEMGVDADFFYFPAYAEKDLGKPVLGAGTLFGITKDSPAARAFVDWLKTPIAHEVWMAKSGFLTPHKGVNTELYGDATLKKMGEILLGADTFRFDGSDLMPGGVGAGAFWTGMVDYAGGKSAQEVADAIQATWDGLK